MDILQGLIETGKAGRSGWRIVNNNGAYGIFNNITSNVLFSILNDGTIGASSNIPLSIINSYSNINVITNYVASSGGSSLWTTSGTKIYYNTSNVGIGTTDPIAPLHIYNTSNARLLLDTTTTGTAIAEFRRGTGADTQNDYRFINDTDGTIKLQVENSTQVFSNLSANLAWFSSNETIIHKNTAINGRVGIGTTYHTTRSLDVLGNANVSGTISVGGLSVSGSSNVVITNSLSSNVSLTIQNSFVSIPTLPNQIVISDTTPSIIGSDRCIIFPYSGTNPTKDYQQFTTTEQLNADILIVGGGGGGGGPYIGGGGGGGGYIYLENITMPVGSYIVKVGRGGTAGTSGLGGNGNNSSITGNINYTALGGGGGAGGSLGGVVSGIGSNGGSGGGGSYRNVPQSAGAGGTSTQLSTYGYGTGGAGNSYGSPWNSGGGGGGASGTTNGTSSTGNSGLANSITGTSVTYAGGGGGGVDGTSPSIGGAGGGGGGANQSGTATAAVAGTDGLGGGGGGSSTSASARGGHGVVIVRYRIIEVISSTIELIRGTTSDSNRDYKLGNYGAEFKIISSTSGVDTDYIRITTSGAIFNPTGTASWNTGSDRRIKENIERASYDKCFDNINKLELNRFNYIEGFNTVSRDNKQLGFIAQEVYDIFPKAISSQGYYSDTLNIPDLLSIDVSQINYTLYGAVKKLIEINNEKDKRIKTLGYQLKTLETFLNISIDTSNIVMDTSNILIDTSNILIDTSNILIDTSNISIDTSNLLDTSNIAIDTSNSS